MKNKTKTILTADRRELVNKLAGLKKFTSDPKQIAAVEGQIAAIDMEFERRKEQADLERKIKSAQESKAKQEAKLTDNEEETEETLYHSFMLALKVYDETKMCFHRSSTPRYFYKESFIDIDRKTKGERKRSELIFFTLNGIGDNWPELEGKSAKRYFRRMVRGEVMTVKNPKTGEFESYSFEKHEFAKLGNTRHIPDPKTYNMVDLNNILVPTDGLDKAPECPIILRALLVALSGSDLVNVNGKLLPTKPETINWLERWFYGIVCADIGNNMLSMPVLFGKGKKGKNAAFDIVIPSMLGREQCFSGVWSTVDSNFSGFKLGKVFMFIDEIPPREEWDTLKNMTGSPNAFVKEKYGAEFEIENTIAHVMGSNQNTYPLPLEDGNQMNRVSPISVVKGETFAEATYKLLEELSPGSVDVILTNLGIDLTKYPTIFDKGDCLLKENGNLWHDKTTLQNFLDYLHYKHKPKDGGVYTLEPLRGQDWNEILNNKPNPITKTVEYIVNQEVDKISVFEVMEIYKICAGDPKQDRFLKHKNNLVAEITPKLEDYGYKLKLRQRIKDKTGSNTTEGQVWYLEGVDPKNYTADYNKYIIEMILPGGRTSRELKYKTEQTDDEKAEDLQKQIKALEKEIWHVTGSKKSAIEAQIRKLKDERADIFKKAYDGLV